MGIAIAGLTADARNLCKYMRTECLNYWYVHENKMPLARMVQQIGDKSQAKTYKVGKRPYGVGLLIAGVDNRGPHLWETLPDGNYYEYFAQAIGARSQSAKTYLEKNYDKFAGSTSAQLIEHAIKALRASA